MAKGYQIGVGVDTKAAKQAIDAGLVDPLEDAQKELTDLGKNKGPEQLERSLKDAQDETERLKKDTEKTADAIEREYKRAYREVKESADDGMRGASEAGTEFKQEALQNFSEVTSSFDGSMSSIQDLAQGTLGGLASSGLPGVGIAAGVAAAGIGLIGGALQNVQEETEASKERAAEWAAAFIEAGGKVLTAAQNTAAGLDIVNDPTRYDEAKKNAEDWGVSVSTAVAAMTGQQWALDAVTTSLDDMNAAYQDALKTAQENPDGLIGPDASKLENQRASVEAGTSALNKLRGEMEAGARQASDYSQFLRDMAENTAGATKKVDEFGDAIYTLPDETQVYVDAETGQATQNVDAIEKKLYGLPSDTVVKLDVDTAAAERKVEQWVRKDRTIRVTIDGKSYGRY